MFTIIWLSGIPSLKVLLQSPRYDGPIVLILLYMLLLLPIWFYVILIYVIVKIFRKAKTKRVRYRLLALVALLYGSLYSGDLVGRFEFYSWVLKNPAITIYGEIDSVAAESIYMPRYRGCGELCAELLMNGYFEAVETDILPDRRWPSSVVIDGPAQLRWRLETEPSVCWQRTNAEWFLGTSWYKNKGLLGQGICFIPEIISGPESQWHVTGTNESEYAPGLEYTKYVRKTFELKRREGAGYKTVAEGRHGTQSVYLFPFVPFVDILLLQRGIRPLRKDLVHGPSSTASFLSLALDLSFPLEGSRIGSLYDESRLAVIHKAARHDNEIVRWSAALAMCKLMREYPGRFEPELGRLRNDKNAGVRKVADTAITQSKGQRRCKSISPSTDSLGRYRI